MTIKNSARLFMNAVVAISLCAFALSCGGGGDSDSGGASGQSGTITITTDLTSIPADGSSSTVIRATIKDSAGNPVRHYTEVVFTTNLGNFRNGGTRYTMTTQPPLGSDGFPDPDADPTGLAEVQFIAGTTPGAAKITVSSNGVTNSIYVSLTGVSGAIVLTASPSSISADGSSSSIITATLTDSGGNPVKPGTPVSFRTSLGFFQNGGTTYSVTTPDSTGIVKVSLIAGFVPGTNFLAATSNEVSQSIEMTFTNLYLSKLSLSANPLYIQADGVSTSLLTAHLETVQGQAIKGSVVTFYYSDPDDQGDPLPADNTWSGTGVDEAVTPAFYSSGSATFIMSYFGNPNTTFTVQLWNMDTSKVAATLINQAGPVSDQSKTVTLGAGNYQFRVVSADGNWTIKVQGSISPTRTGDPTVLDVQRTDENGNATYVYTSTLEVGPVEITAISGEFNSDVVTDVDKNALHDSVIIYQTDGPPPPVNVTAQDSEINANGLSETTIEAFILDGQGNIVPDGTVVTFSATAGTLSDVSTTATIQNTVTAGTSNGVASVKLTSVASATTIESTVTATVGSNSSSVIVTFRGVSLTNMAATPAAIFANGTDKSTITVRLVDSTGVAIAGETIVFSTTGGTITTAAESTDSGGVATTELTAPTVTGTATITATYGSITASTTISFQASGVGSITLTASPTSIPADGASSSTITATLTDSSGTAVSKGTSVTFATDLGTFSNGSQTYTVITPTETGVVSVALIAGTTDGAAKITASAIGTSQTAYVYIGGGTVTITLSANPTSIPADGSSSSTITATLTDTTGAAVTPGTSVTFSTNLGTFTGGVTTLTVTTPDATGIVSVALISATTSGLATVTAISSGASQSVTVGFTGGNVGSITLTANPTTLPADGSSSSAVTATIVDPAGKAVPQGTSVTFTTNLGTFSNGGTTQTVTTQDATGTVTVSLIAGTTAGTADVLCVSSGVSQKVSIQITGGAGTPASLSLGLSQTSVKSDNSDSSTITATVLDANKAVLEGIVVAFSASGGQISASSGKTDANGQAKITFSSGTTDRSNQTVTITATVSGLAPQLIPIQISGSTLTITAGNTNLTAGGATTTLTVTAKDAGGNLVFGAPITLSTSGPEVTVSPTSGTTAVNGQFTATVTPVSDGTVTVTAKWSTSPEASQAFTVGTTGNVFEILLPATDPFTSKTRATANTVSGVSVTFKDNGSGTPDTIERAGAFAGFAAGEVIMVGGSTNNNGVYTISSTVPPTNDVLTLVDSDSLTDETTTTAIVTNGVLVWVRAPDPIQNLKFATSIGIWDNGSSPIVTKTVSASNYSWAVLTASVAGSATVQVSDAADSSTVAYTTVAFAVPSGDAAQLAMVSNVYTVAPSVGGIENTATLTATVRTSQAAGGQAVSGATVAFSIENPTGGGETIKPVVKITDSAGQATTTFTSGSLSSGAEGVKVRAAVNLGELISSDSTIVFNDNTPNADTITRAGGGFLADFEANQQIWVQGTNSNNGYYTIKNDPGAVTDTTLTLVSTDSLSAEGPGVSVTISHVITDTVSIVIGGTAGSVVIGRGTVIYDQDDATYRLPMSALVTDSNGNAVSGAVVSLSAWPLQYAPGVWYDTDPDPQAEKYAVYYTGSFIDNEDANENLILDPGEDKDGNGKLTPENSSAGGVPVPSQVTTDENGVAAFNLIYLKAQAKWINSRIRASTYVVGTETTSSLSMVLPAEKTQAESGLLPDSPYPIGLVSGTAFPPGATYTFPVFQGTGDAFTPSANLSKGSSSMGAAINDYDYTYDPTGGTQAVVGNWVWDYITVINSTAGLGAYFPVRIIIQ